MDVKKSNYIRRIIIMVIGIIFMGIGISLFKLSLMGNDPSTAFVISIGNIIGIDFAIVLICMNCIWFIAEWFFARHLIGVGTFVNWFCIGPIASFCEKLVLAHFTIPESFVSRLCIMAPGVLILSFACAMYQTSDVGIAPYDALSLILTEKTGIKYFWCRMFTDGVCVLIAFALGGIIGLGTLVCALGLGPFIAFFSDNFAKKIIEGRPQ